MSAARELRLCLMKFQLKFILKMIPKTKTEKRVSVKLSLSDLPLFVFFFVFLYAFFQWYNNIHGLFNIKSIL